MSSPATKSRTKRLKVASACGVCRRKKTKCNGENPCSGCLKANVKCEYLNVPKTKASSSSSANQDTVNNNNHSGGNASHSICVIEDRLTVIENTLQKLLSALSNDRDSPVGAATSPTPSLSAHDYASPWPSNRDQRLYPTRDRCHPRPPFHVAHYQNRHMPRQEEEDVRMANGRFHPYHPHESKSTPTRLPPIVHNNSRYYQPSMSTSSSTSSSSSSISSPKLSAIRSLLNNDQDEVPLPGGVLCNGQAQPAAHVPYSSSVPSTERSV